MTQSPSTSQRDLSFLKDSITLPSLPGVAIEVMRLTQEENAELEEITEAIGRDPALAARLLKLSNSAFFGRSTEVATLGDSVMVLGMKTVRLAAVSFSVVPLIGSGKRQDYDFREFWARAVTAAVCCRCLARQVARDLADEAFLCGLLMDIGIPILVNAAPERYLPALHTMDAGHPDLAEERRGLGYTHADVGAELMRRWRLPQSVTLALAHHHDPGALGPDVDPRTARLTEIVRVAHDVATLMVSDVDPGRALQRARASAQMAFGLDEDALDAIIEEMTEPITQMAELIAVDIGDHPDGNGALERAREDIVATPLVDSAGLAAERSGGGAGSTPSTDALTGIKDAATFNATLSEIIELAIERGECWPVSLILVDLDHLEDLNDLHGHAAGDRALQVISDVLQRCTRAPDHLFRLKDDAFAVITPDLTRVQAKALSQRMLRAIGSTMVVHGDKRFSVTASLGVVTTVGNLANLTAEEMLRAATEQLHDAKEAGRNQIRSGELS